VGTSKGPVRSALIACALGLALLSLRALTAAPAVPRSSSSFTAFETGPTRPLALSENGARLYALNTPDGKLEIFDVTPSGLARAYVVPVGMEPVAVALRGSEAWVVNHLSDSVSIVDLSSSPPRVVRTLLVGDEPGDVVFAGPQGARAFVSCAHRGQNAPFDPQLQTAGIGRADVWVFDADQPGAGGGTPMAIVTLFGDTPRALAKSPDGSRVYAAVFQSGNRTTAITETVVSGNGQGLPPDPAESVYQNPKPPVGLIVKFDTASSTWKDERPTSNWNGASPYGRIS